MRKRPPNHRAVFFRTRAALPDRCGRPKSQINLAWADNAGNETGFIIERAKGSTGTDFTRIATVGANVTRYSSTGLTANTAYRYRIYAYNASGASGYSNIASAKTPRR